MRPGAKRADASQVNTSLVLSDDAYADAVPNLDIEENDVRCAHASSVGPVDAEQRWYLESRGVAPADAVQLILEGFFDEVERLLDDAVLGASLRDAISRLDLCAAVDGTPDRCDDRRTCAVRARRRSTRRCRCRRTVGELDVVVVRCGAELYCLENVCSHEHFPLSDGEVDPLTCEIECARHGAMFDLATRRAALAARDARRCGRSRSRCTTATSPWRSP